MDIGGRGIHIVIAHGALHDGRRIAAALLAAHVRVIVPARHAILRQGLRLGREISELRMVRSMMPRDCRACAAA